ncbi:MAG: hypothetical protein E7602_02715 [Ruminococcaceae bacterium]|nr:hypothetical protein [Oscillospiraceae bacterium]
MKKAREIAFLGIICALSVVFLMLGSILDVLDITAAIIASLLLFIANEELKAKSLMVYFATVVISLLFTFVGSPLPAIEYAIFAIYPILKPVIEKTPRIVSYILKAIYIVLASCGTVLLMSFFIMPFAEPRTFFIYLLLFILVIVLFDLLLLRFKRYYQFKLRHTLKIDRFFN